MATMDCPACGGEGWLPSLPTPATCPYCKGTGKNSSSFELLPAERCVVCEAPLLADDEDGLCVSCTDRRDSQREINEDDEQALGDYDLNGPDRPTWGDFQREESGR